MKTLADIPVDFPLLVINGEWDESKHPRDDDGKFTDAGGGGGDAGRQTVGEPVYSVSGKGGFGLTGEVFKTADGGYAAKFRDKAGPLDDSTEYFRNFGAARKAAKDGIKG